MHLATLFSPDRSYISGLAQTIGYIVLFILAGGAFVAIASLAIKWLAAAIWNVRLSLMRTDCPSCSVPTRTVLHGRLGYGTEYLNCRKCGCHAKREKFRQYHGPTGNFYPEYGPWCDVYSKEEISISVKK